MTNYAHIVEGRVREIILLPDDLVPGRDIFTEGFAQELVPARAEVEQGWLFEAGVFTAPPLPPPFVPISVSSAQAKIALMRAGHLSAVRAAIETLGDQEVAIWFSDARVWERTNPHVVAVAAALPLTEAAVDDLFRAAALIAA